MKIAFFHDAPILRCENRFYRRQVPSSYFERYVKRLGSGDRLYVYSRQREITREEAAGCTELTHERISFVAVPDYRQGMNVLRVIPGVKSAVLDSDYCFMKIPGFIPSMAVHYCKAFHKPYLVEVIGCAWDGLRNYGHPAASIIAPFAYAATKQIIKKAPYALYVTSEFLQLRYPSSGITEHCSNVELQEVEDTLLDHRLEKIEALPGTDNLVIGTLAPLDLRFKGQEYVIRAISRLKKEGSEFTYRLAGQGDPSFIENLAETYGVTDNIEIVGALPHEKVFEFLDGLDLYAQPSRQEGLPRALIEAMSRGLPAVGARTAGIPELIGDDYIFSNSRRNIAEICTILKNLTKQDLSGQAERNFRVSKQFSRKILEHRRDKFFSDFLGDRSDNEQAELS